MTRTHFHRYSPLVAVCVLWCAAGEPKTVLGQSADAAAADAPDFEAAIAPLLVKRCLECHNTLQAAGGLVFATREGAMAGGDSGPAIVPGDLDASYLMARVTSGEMPPAKQGIPQSLDEVEIDLLRRWIKSGASWPEGRVLDPYEATSESRGGRDWWSFQKIVRPPLPVVQSNVRVRTPIDAFIVSALEAQGMEMAPQADDRTILRRLYEDMLGLPASPEQVELYVSDTRPDKYERLVDRLLASPHFGERWGRYWLDLVRFAETCGYERDQTKPNAWRYRDWVVQSVNQDRPYDRFVVEQLAGDEVADRSEQTVIGTGFLRLGTWNDEPNDPHEYKYERLEDMVHATGTAFLGLTIKCARCHDHKFDPIPQTDYYKMASAFWPGPIEPRGSELLGGVSAAELGYDVLGWTDLSPSATPLHLLIKGDPQRPAQEVEPGFLTLSPELLAPFAPPPADAKTSHRRLQWANWIVDSRNPLTARVAVNRLWQHHFEAGLVRTPNNFGFKGERPTHPELLDWLADELVVGGWTLKRLHRLILHSSVYRQSAVHPQREEYELRDSGNRLWWHSPRRRLDAEALRDAMLAASGQIDLSIGGPSFFAEVSADALEGLSMKGNAWQASPALAQRRRSLYMFSKRSLISPLMTVFDFCDTTLPCEQRDVTTVAPQALALLNNAFSHRMSEALAKRTAAQAGSDSQARIRRAWQLVLARSPTPGELQAAQEHLDRQERRFAEQLARGAIENANPLPAPSGIALWLSSDDGVMLDDQGRVSGWHDRSGQGHDAAQGENSARPALVADAIGGRPALRFDGAGRFLHVAGQVLTEQQFSMFAVVSDADVSGMHREIFSNWDGAAGNSTSSVFLGLTGPANVRLSDDFTAGEVSAKGLRFVLAAVASPYEATIYQNSGQLARKGGPLSPRNLQTPYVIGQQGNIQGEYWTGDIAELIVYGRALTEAERDQVTNYLLSRYNLAPPKPPPTPDMLALTSLCHVLLNTNEFIYVD